MESRGESSAETQLYVDEESQSTSDSRDLNCWQSSASSPFRANPDTPGFATPSPAPRPNRDPCRSIETLRTTLPNLPSPVHSRTCPPLSRKDSYQMHYRVDEPLTLSTGRIHSGQAADVSQAVSPGFPQQYAMSFPYPSNGHGVQLSAGTGLEPVCATGSAQVWPRPVSRALFCSANVDNVPLTFSSMPLRNGIGTSSLEFKCATLRRKACDTPVGDTYYYGEAASVPEVNSRQVLRRPNRPQSQRSSRKTAEDSRWEHIFGVPNKEKSIQWPQMTEHLQALGALEFTRAFQLLATLNGEPLDTFCVEHIKKLKDVPPGNVATYISHLDGLRKHQNVASPAEPAKQKVQIKHQRYDCCVQRTGVLSFQICEQREALNALQRCFGPDKVLRVFFDEVPKFRNDVYRNILRRGLVVGLRLYRFWTFKDTGKDFEKKKKPVGKAFWSSIHCYFVCTNSLAEVDLKNPGFRIFETIAAARCYMMHIHKTPSIAKYISRLQLALSQTQPVEDLDLSAVTVGHVDDIICTDETDLKTVSTDGTGYISVDLAKDIFASLRKGIKKQHMDTRYETEEYPSLMQIRLFYYGAAYKGTLLANNTLQAKTILLRKSMQKVEKDPRLAAFPSFNSLEICGFSIPFDHMRKPGLGKTVHGKPRDAKLSRDLTLLLTLGGVPGSFFTDLVDEAIQKVHSIINDRIAALEAIREWDSDSADIARRMLLVGIPLKEPYLQKTLMELTKHLLQDFRKGRVVLPNACNLYGTADPTGTLKPHQVAISLGYGLVSWPKVAVYKSPGKHPGDIHIFETVANEKLQAVVGSGKYVIIFSTQGSRSVPGEIANGDLDGDRFLTCWNTKVFDMLEHKGELEWEHLQPGICRLFQLLADYQEHTTRWVQPPVQGNELTMHSPSDHSPEDLEDSLIDKYLNSRFSPSQDIGIISNWWLQHLDQHLYLKETNPKQSAFHYQRAIELIDTFCAIVDSEKTGIKVVLPRHLRPRRTPHFLEKGKETSDTGLGVYTSVEEAKEYNSTTILGQIYDKAQQAAESWKLPLYDEIELDPAFHYNQVKDFEGPFSDLYAKWTKNFKDYNEEMRDYMSKEKSGTPSRPAGVLESSPIVLKYRKILYGADTLSKSTEPESKIFADASAIYAVVYTEGRRRQSQSGSSSNYAPRFHFAWSVAGVALCKMYKRYHEELGGEDAYDMSCKVSQEVFCKRNTQEVTKDDEDLCEED